MSLIKNNYEGLVFINANNSQIVYNNGYPNQFIYTFSNNIKPQNCQIALVNCFIYYSWYNIAAQFNNQTVSWSFNGSTYNITFPPGYYAISDINNFIQISMKNNGVYLVDSFGNDQYIWSIVANSTYYCSTITATVYNSLPSGWTNPNSIPLNITVQINFDASNFCTLLGFQPSTSYPPSVLNTTYQYNSGVPEISPTYVVNINLDRCVNNGFLSTNINTLYQISGLNSTYGSQLVVEPNPLLFCDLDSSQYNKIIITFCDQNNNPLNMLDSNVSLTLQITNKNNLKIM